MKRCPQCEFIYPDADTVCDFDQNALVDASEAEIAAVTNTPERPALRDLAATHAKNLETRKSRRGLPIAAAACLVLGVSIVGVYIAVKRQLTPQPIQQTESRVAVVPASTPAPSPSLSMRVVAEPSPEPSAEVAAKALPNNSRATAHSTTNAGQFRQVPVATAKLGKAVILLSSGGKVEADQV